ncbi:hypothetical protein BV25DRAFT_1838352 [Artomyces pyxidatus]|uniref:Uncharacterized protein n=1 Tax=Artomyces pyxidatus TaxID=48021 RepID=A0ACB8T308_9AGAM|nr:hypothetical protein BV25DRAFT_1838352 [Artomyces pyxidatus]
MSDSVSTLITPSAVIEAVCWHLWDQIDERHRTGTISDDSLQLKGIAPASETSTELLQAFLQELAKLPNSDNNVGVNPSETLLVQPPPPPVVAAAPLPQVHFPPTQPPIQPPTIPQVHSSMSDADMINAWVLGQNIDLDLFAPQASLPVNQNTFGMMNLAAFPPPTQAFPMTDDQGFDWSMFVDGVPAPQPVFAPQPLFVRPPTPEEQREFLQQQRELAYAQAQDKMLLQMELERQYLTGPRVHCPRRKGAKAQAQQGPKRQKTTQVAGVQKRRRLL